MWLSDDPKRPGQTSRTWTLRTRRQCCTSESNADDTQAEQWSSAFADFSGSSAGVRHFDLTACKTQSGQMRRSIAATQKERSKGVVKLGRTLWWGHARCFTSFAAAIKAMLSSVASPGRIQLRQFRVAQYTLIPQGEQQRTDSNRRKVHFVNRIALAAVHHGTLQALCQL